MPTRRSSAWSGRIASTRVSGRRSAGAGARRPARAAVAVVADLRVFLDANVLFTAAYSPDGLSALLVELGAAGRVTLLTSPLAIVEAERNLEAKRPAALATLRRSLAGVGVVREPAPADVERLTPPELSSKDRPLLAAAIVAHATHFVTGDVADFGRWMDRRDPPPRQGAAPREVPPAARPRWPPPRPARSATPAPGRGSGVSTSLSTGRLP